MVLGGALPPEERRNIHHPNGLDMREREGKRERERERERERD